MEKRRISAAQDYTVLSVSQVTWAVPCMSEIILVSIGPIWPT